MVYALCNVFSTITELKISRASSVLPVALDSPCHFSTSVYCCWKHHLMINTTCIKCLCNRTTAVQTQATLEETRPSTTRSDPGRNHTAQHNTNTSRCVRYLQERDTPLWPAHTNRNIFFYISFNRCVYIEKLIKLVHTTSVILKSYSNLLLPRIQVLHNQSSKLTTMLHSTTITCIELVNI